MKKQIALGALLACVSSSYGQLSLGAHTWEESTYGSISVVGETQSSVDALQTSDTVALSAYNLSNVRPNSSGSGYQINQYYTLSTGAIPIEISSFKYFLNGKVVVGGGNATGGFATTWKSVVNIWAYNDANDNGIFDSGDSRYGGNPIKTTGTANTILTTQSGNGYSIYTQTYSATDPASYILGAHSDYLIEWRSLGDISGSNIGGPPSTITYEVTEPIFAGHVFGFEYQAVPEPGTMIILGIAGVAALRRRRM
jgi:hypothetical protein